MALYNVVEVRLKFGTQGNSRKVVHKNLTKGEARRIEAAKNEEALKVYYKELKEHGAAQIVSYIAIPVVSTYIK